MDFNVWYARVPLNISRWASSLRPAVLETTFQLVINVCSAMDNPDHSLVANKHPSPCGYKRYLFSTFRQ
jgi:hypothetical protein